MLKFHFHLNIKNISNFTLKICYSNQPTDDDDFSAGVTTEDRAVTPTATATPSDAASGERTGIRKTNATSDPAIDEHFKRSLGLKEYAAVFSSSATSERNPGLTGEFLCCMADESCEKIKIKIL